MLLAMQTCGSVLIVQAVLTQIQLCAQQCQPGLSSLFSQIA